MEILWLVVALGIPLAINPWGANPFELPKTLLLRALVLLMALAVALRFINGGDKASHAPPHRPSAWLVLPALAFGGAQIIATIFSSNPRVSLWGSYERQQGLLTLSAYLALFLFTAFNLRTRAQQERLWNVLVWGSVPVILYGFLQALGFDPLAWQTDAASPVLSTVGRSNFLGSYLTLVIPLTIGRLLSTRRRVPTLLLLLGQLICMALTQARGAWLGLGAGVFALALVWTWTNQNKRLMWLTLSAALVVLGLVALPNLPNSSLADAPIPGLNRLAGIFRTDEGSSAARLTIWQATLPLVAARPWLGYGQETMRPIFAKIFPPQLVYYQGRNVTVDRAHNFWLDLLMSSGLAGLGAFIALLVGFGRLARRGLASISDNWNRAIWSALIGTMIGHIIDLQFGFDTTTSATIFWLALAMAAASPLPALELPNQVSKPHDKFGWLVFVLPVGLTLYLIGVVCIQPLMADTAYWNSQQSSSALPARQAEAERAVALVPLETEYREGLAQVYIQNGNPVAAENQLAIADSLSPNDPQVWLTWGNLYAYWGDIDPRHYPQAETCFRRALELAPNVAAYHTALGLVLTRQRRLDEGLVELERAVALDATDGVAYHYLADLYHTLGREDESAQARKEAKRWGGE